MTDARGFTAFQTYPARQNPFPIYDHGSKLIGWRYADENNKCSKLFPTQLAALRALIDEVDPPWYLKVWAGVKEGWKNFRLRAASDT